VSRIFIRFALPRDAARLVSDRVLTDAPAAGESWETRIEKWLAEQKAGRRVILLAEDASGLLGMAQLVFKFPPGYNDPEAANGFDIAMLESLRTRPGAHPGVMQQLISDIQAIARKRNIATLTFCVSMNNNSAIAQVKSWGFTEFRIMPEPTRMLAFFRKSVD
jgi:ribosomal protein S18 acetylase RimI-like enzyme